MKKYRIVNHYPRGYTIEKRYCIFFWKKTVYDQKNREFIFDSIESAKKNIRLLKLSGKTIYSE